MQKRKRYHYILIGLFVLLIASISCNFPGLSVSIPQSEPTHTLPPIETQDEFQSPRIGETFVLEVTETQLTSVLNSRFSDIQEPTISDGQVFLQNGQMELQASVNQNGMILPLNVILTISIDGNGKPTYKIISSSIGPFPLPASVTDQLSGMVENAFADELFTLSNNYYIENIEIQKGVMTIDGYAQ